MLFDSIVEKLKSEPLGVLLTALLVLPLVYLVVASYAGDDAKPHPNNGTRRVLRPASTLPLIENTWDVIRFVAKRHDWIASLCAKSEGEPVLVRAMGTPDMTLLSTPQALEDVFKNQFDNFPKGPMLHEYTHELLGDGIFAVDNEKWVHQRKTASHLFTMRALRDSMTTTIQHHLVVLENIFRRAIASNETVDLFRMFNRFTMEAFAEIGFGVQMNCLDAEKEHPFQTAFDRSQQTLGLRFVVPSWLWRIQRWLGVGKEGQLLRDMKVVDSTILEIVEKALERHSSGLSEQGDEDGKDIVSLFLDNMTIAETDFNAKFLRDVVINFLIAGRDTSAQALSWFYVCLNKNPRVEAKIRKEISEKLPGLMGGECVSPSMDQVSELVYLEAALKETLRLYPSVPIVGKTAVRDTVLSDGTFIAANALAAIPMYAIGRMPHVWGFDAEEFKPERWIDADTGKIIAVSAYKFIAFNAGPRLCLGKNLAMLEMKLIAACLLSKYHVELERPEDVTYAISFTLPMKGALNAKISAPSPCAF